MVEMRKMLSEAVMWLVCMALSFSCTVKENRNLCPCQLELDFSDVDTVVMKSVDMCMVASDGFLLSEVIGHEQWGSGRIYRIPRTEMSLNVYYGGQDAVDDMGRLSISPGDECPPVFVHTSVFDADCEYRYEKVAMWKNYCQITINVAEPENFGYGLVVRGNVSGYDVDGRPREGEFLVRKSIDKEGVCKVLVPRQLDGSLMLDVDGDDGTVKRFALGEYVLEAGYDWNAKELKDVTVGLDYSLTSLSLSVQGWDEENFFDVEM